MTGVQTCALPIWFGPLSGPGLVLLVMLIVIIAIAVAGGMGWLPIGALDAPAAELGADPTASAASQAMAPGFGAGTMESTMTGWVGVDHGMRTGVE